MKIAILGDLHYGIKSNDYVIDKKLNEVLTNRVFPYIKQNNIKHIIQLGDIFENRKGVSSYSGYNYVKYFLLPIIQNDLILYQILGNHDIFYDHDNIVNTLKMFFVLMNNSNLNLIEDKEKVILGNRELYFVSYSSKAELEYLYGDILFGHFNIEGFEIQKGISVHNGIKQNVFKQNFNKVISGHIHRRDRQNNIWYTGSLVENDFGESDFIHGFYVLETDTLDLEFIPIEEKIFLRIDGNEIEKYENLEDKVVEIKFSSNSSIIDNEKVIEKLKSLSPTDIKIKYVDSVKKNKIVVQNYDFLNVTKEYIDNEHDGLNKEILYKIVMKFYENI
jgi:DNA repair exonuclease SbcCD nuclease subunit